MVTKYALGLQFLSSITLNNLKIFIYFKVYEIFKIFLSDYFKEQNLGIIRKKS